VNIAVRPADLVRDRESIIDMLFRYLTPFSNGERFDWLYTNNPHGHARVWLAIDTADGTIAGLASAFPRRMHVSGREEPAWVLGDFCINKAYRTLGPALQLQRACLTDVNDGEATLSYDFPSPTMMAVYERLHIQPSAQMVRFAKPLRVDRHARRLLKSSHLSRGVSRPLNFLLQVRDRGRDRTSSLTISPQNGECGKEFSVLCEQVIPAHGACIQRSAEYLNWRYFAHPHRRHQLVTARRDGLLLAYVVVASDTEHPLIVDLFGVNDPAVVTALVRWTINMLRERGALTVSAPLTQSHPWVPLLTGLGFRPREAKPVVVYVPHRCHSTSDGIEQRLYLMDGDRES